MKLSDFLQNIALGELSGSSLVEIGQYEITPTQVPRVINALNQALDYFYSNFYIKESQVVIELVEGISYYYLDSDYAKSNIDSPHIKYINDTNHNPFKDDVLKIRGVFGMSGREFTINDEFSSFGVYVPEWNCVHIPESHGETHLTVVYQASHPKINLREPLDSKVQISIPSSYISALQTYVACLVYQNMGGSHLNESNALFAKFKTLTEELKQSGIGVNVQTGINIKPILRSFV